MRRAPLKRINWELTVAPRCCIWRQMCSKAPHILDVILIVSEGNKREYALASALL
jgi:hypothetical protein